MKSLFKRYISNESGATAIEYGLLAALIGIAIMGGARYFSSSLNNQWNYVDTTFKDSTP